MSGSGNRPKRPRWVEQGNWQPSRRHLLAVGCVAELYAIEMNQIRSRLRPWRFSRPRQVAFWMLRRVFPALSYPMIGQVLGKFDHSTVIHGERAVEKRRAGCAEYTEQTDIVLETVRQRLTLDQLESFAPESLAQLAREAADGSDTPSVAPPPVPADWVPPPPFVRATPFRDPPPRSKAESDPLLTAIQADIDAREDQLMLRDAQERRPFRHLEHLGNREGLGAEEIAARRRQREEARRAHEIHWLEREAQACGRRRRGLALSEMPA
ncbi:helix-turn-helix domain-containing protein [Alteriqipengyuania sp.]|uniref:helix-turn-helix domain-containing protein n=1 Tax=Alteriqipengyuania sp. TaxID=2800692 RepID=UPI0035147683